ncbi:tRNA guanosine(34) transglycosylase Tgt [Candidatus Saccharibacteria bacterium TM7i]|nr:tRNA guanosine(34) transglycosylase Tgt [Candidatus Saccharibacteria bacterium TM7i]
MQSFSFTITHAPGDARFMRTGVIKTPHGEIKTPAFIPVGTQAAMKALTVDMMHGVEAQALLSNAYHLYIQPGHELIRKAGGIHRFMNWNKPVVTDSGGFQVLSLGSGYKKTIEMTAAVATENTKKSARHAFVDEDGVTFKSHRDGSLHKFTPEVSMNIQNGIGADICFAFDELTSLIDPYDYQVEALERTRRWAIRSLDEWKRLRETTENYQALFGVIQGANYEDLRRKAAQDIGAMDFDGFGIGGAIEKSQLGQIVRWVNEELPANKPKHLLGISEPSDIFAAVEQGVDTFDCVAPTREARNGAIYTHGGRYSVRRAEHKEGFIPLEEGCECYVCQNYSRAYLHHLFKAKEMLAATLASYHNEWFTIRLVEKIRQAIESDTYDAFKAEFIAKYYAK